jgi:Protein of unknown function (DUF1566)
MKKQITPISILFAAILVFSFSSKVNAQANIIGKPTPIPIQYSLQVAQFDFPKQMNWLDAKKACEGLGEGWRLPTKDELNSMYINKNTIGGFSTNSYWSSSEMSLFAWNQYFNYGGRVPDPKTNMNYVRAVRPL